MTNSVLEDILYTNKKLEYVMEYVYLGKIILLIYQMSKEIETRIAAGWKNFC